MNINYPEEWNELPKYERKMKIKELSQEIEQKAGLVKKITKWGVISFTLVLIVVGLILLTKKSP